MQVVIARFVKYLAGTDYGELIYISLLCLSGCTLKRGMPNLPPISLFIAWRCYFVAYMSQFQRKPMHLEKYMFKTVRTSSYLLGTNGCHGTMRRDMTLHSDLCKWQMEPNRFSVRWCNAVNLQEHRYLNVAIESGCRHRVFWSYMEGIIELMELF